MWLPLSIFHLFYVFLWLYLSLTHSFSISSFYFPLYLLFLFSTLSLFQSNTLPFYLFFYLTHTLYRYLYVFLSGSKLVFFFPCFFLFQSIFLSCSISPIFLSLSRPHNSLARTLFRERALEPLLSIDADTDTDADDDDEEEKAQSLPSKQQFRPISCLRRSSRHTTYLHTTEENFQSKQKTFCSDNFFSSRPASEYFCQFQVRVLWLHS